jgi:hypothetical protein
MIQLLDELEATMGRMKSIVHHRGDLDIRTQFGGEESKMRKLMMLELMKL